MDNLGNEAARVFTNLLSTTIGEIGIVLSEPLSPRRLEILSQLEERGLAISLTLGLITFDEYFNQIKLIKSKEWAGGQIGQRNTSS